MAVATEGRGLALVVAVATVLYVGAEWLGGQLGWPPRYLFLADLAAGAAFLWAMVAAYGIWRKRR